MISFGRLSFLVGLLVFVSGLLGFRRSCVLGRMLGSGLILFLLLIFLVVKDTQTQSSRISIEPHLIDALFQKAWMPFFCRSGHPVVTADQFLDFVGHLLHQESYLDLPRITVGICRRLLGLRSLLLEVWVGGLGMKLRRCRCLGFLVLLFFWIWLRLLESGHKVISMQILP